MSSTFPPGKYRHFQTGLEIELVEDGGGETVVVLYPHHAARVAEQLYRWREQRMSRYTFVVQYRRSVTAGQPYD